MKITPVYGRLITPNSYSISSINILDQKRTPVVKILHLALTGPAIAKLLVTNSYATMPTPDRFATPIWLIKLPGE